MEKLFLTKRLKCRLTFFLFLTLLWGQNIFAQQVSISGKITESDKTTPLPGVAIMEKGTANGTVTDLDGNYSITVQGNDAVLLISFIGFEPQEISVNGQTTINVVMTESATELGEVVAIGYGTVKRRDVTGSISSVQGDDLNAIPVSTAAEAMAGKLAGVQVITTEGSPDADISIRVRGGGSITQNNSPLYIVDGFPVSTISDIPASEIQSIDVLKDASSTAIYGSRGANGVVIITTKGGKEGKVKVSYNAYMGWSELANRLNSLGVEDYVNYQYEWALLNDEGSGNNNSLEKYEQFFGQYQDIDMYAGQPGNDWIDQVYGRTGKAFNHDLTISGGSEKFAYSFGYAGRDSKEIMLGSDYKRNNLSLKLDNKPNEKVKLSFSMRYSDTKINGGVAIEQTGATPSDAVIRHAISYPSLSYNNFGNFTDDDLSSQLNHPFDAVNDNDRQQQRTRYTLGGSFSWKILDELEIKIDGGLDYYARQDDRFRGLTTYYVSNTPPSDYQNMPAVQSWGRKNVSFRNANTLNYDFKKLFAGNKDHLLTVLVGQELIKTESSVAYNEVFGLPVFFDSELAFNLVSQGYSNQYSNTINPEDNLLSFFGRVSYSYKGKYLFRATYRADGSSKFGEGNKWGYFPSAAVAWRISEESFMSSMTDFLSDLKLRVSYGTAGNNIIPGNQISQVYNSQFDTRINTISTYWAPSSDMANPGLKWETTYTRNIGLDFGLFNNRLSGTAELYYNTTKDLLIRFPVPGSGYESQYRNMGETENKGFELSLNWVAVNKPNFGLDIGFNIGFNNNKIVSLGVMDDFVDYSSWASTEIGGDYLVAEGYSLGRMIGYMNEGRYEVSDFEPYTEADGWVLKTGVSDNSDIINTDLRPGVLKLKDINDDGIVDVDDIAVIGNYNPDHTGGLTLNARAYGFDLSAVFSWSYGNDVYNANKIEFTTGRYQFFNLIDMMAEGERWTNLDQATGELVNDPATLEAMNANTSMWSPYMGRRVFSDWAVEDASYLRLNTLSLGYTLPQAISDRLKIQRLRVYTSVYNVFVLTNYTGFDPEVSTRRNSVLTPGVDYSAYPKSRQVLFGLNLTF